MAAKITLWSFESLNLKKSFPPSRPPPRAKQNYLLGVIGQSVNQATKNDRLFDVAPTQLVNH